MVGEFEVKGHAGGVLVLGADSEKWHVLLGRDSWGRNRSSYSLFSACNPKQEELERVVARRFCQETRDAIWDEETLYQHLKSENTHTISVWRNKGGKSLEYRVYIVTAKVTIDHLKHRKGGDCGCTGCSFQSRLSDSSHPHAGKDALRWQGLERFLQAEGLEETEAPRRRQFTIPVKYDVVDIVNRAVDELRAQKFPSNVNLEVATGLHRAVQMGHNMQ